MRTHLFARPSIQEILIKQPGTQASIREQERTPPPPRGLHSGCGDHRSAGRAVIEEHYGKRNAGWGGLPSATGLAPLRVKRQAGQVFQLVRSKITSAQAQAGCFGLPGTQAPPERWGHAGSGDVARVAQRRPRVTTAQSSSGQGGRLPLSRGHRSFLNRASVSSSRPEAEPYITQLCLPLPAFKQIPEVVTAELSGWGPRKAPRSARPLRPKACPPQHKEQHGEPWIPTLALVYFLAFWLRDAVKQECGHRPTARTWLSGQRRNSRRSSRVHPSSALASLSPAKE
uniref:Uncharacterized protein LOC112823769 isoform X2 n=1 Tax=Callorhinus ursinus TaxID=34884 RepID=A0A3Q7P1A3_CALUR|nr:uncharacterized protein LOC112823769 isoform X2 [Callorhinus ursinus]